MLERMFSLFPNLKMDTDARKVKDPNSDNILISYKFVRASYETYATDTHVKLIIGYTSDIDKYFICDLTKFDKQVETAYDSMEELMASFKKMCRVPQEVEDELRQVRSYFARYPGQYTKLIQKRFSREDLNQYIARPVHLVEALSTTVYLDNLKERFLTCIRAYDAALCAMYTLTDSDIIRELAKLNWASLIVDKGQYEGRDPRWKAVDYDCLKGIDTNPGSSMLIDYGFAGTRNEYLDRNIDGIKFANFIPKDASQERISSKASFHTKFCVFCDVDVNEIDDAKVEHETHQIRPRAVWIGSYNPTPTGDQSIQSAVLLREPTVVSAFAMEFLSLYRAVSKLEQAESCHDDN